MIPTIDSIREELRRAIFQLIFWGSAHRLESHTEEYRNGQVSAQNLAAFGANTGLITKEEADDWLDVIYDRNDKCLGDIAEKYQ